MEGMEGMEGMVDMEGMEGMKRMEGMEGMKGGGEDRSPMHLLSILCRLVIRGACSEKVQFDTMHGG